ncbi:helix-hairpin-helix domain-containing protein [Mycoplasma buteonis]|uniref:helix-hairpin-helix domain-containing protein n=1 Tax=Mycoplasma buteonis TaxID=171280 RepID=UPI000569BF37|nr:Tex-like N-terminal domain-containing protein [Mycoplasma buteonis]
MNPNVIKKVAQHLRITEKQVNIVLDLLEDKNTVPFISRYRKDLTGGLDEEQIYQIETLYKYSYELDERKNSILQILAEKKLLTDVLKEKIVNVKTKSELEALYEPFKVGKVTKATAAIELGLEPLAKVIFSNKNINFNPLIEAQKYLNKDVTTVEFALEQANYIIAQWISQDFKLREEIKENINRFGILKTSFKKSAVDEQEKFKNYYEYQIPIRYIKNHNVLAINRGVKLKILKLDFEYSAEKLITLLLRRLDKTNKNHANLKLPAEDAFKRLIQPSVEREIFNDLFEKAEKNAILIFANSVEKLLFAPALQGHNILAIDPAFVNGCKLAALNQNGDVLEIAKIYPNAPKFEIKKAAEIVYKMILAHKIDIIVIGNGTASRETEQFIAKLIKTNNLKVKYAIVSEVGASVYSASKVAIEEFPNLSVEERSAINIGRKFLDPLNELVKIEPKSIGVGQYQHDLNEKELDNYLTFKVEKVVNTVGVDINTATKSILEYISGISSKQAEKIVAFRKENGSFLNREQIKKVPGLGPKTYEQAIGFLRIFNSDNFLDKTFIHPESYDLANKIIKNEKLNPSEDGIKNLSLNVEELINKYNSNYYEIELILKALSNPVKNFETNKQGFLLKDELLNVEDLKLGDLVSGTVENITDFGIFVYIGIKQSLFIHISDLNLQTNDSIFDYYYPSQVIRAQITGIDLNRNRISGKIISD